MKNKFTPEKLKKIKIGTVAVIMLVITAVSFIIPLRPERSDTEKRKLTSFPEFSFASLTDGTYFSGIALWFSDTVPFRDLLVSANSKIQNLLGTSYSKTGFNEGIKGDDIPDVPQTSPGTVPSTEINSSSPSETTSAPAEEPSSAQPSSSADPGNVQTLGNIIIVGNAGFEYYNFVQATADKYSAAVNNFAAYEAGKVNVYDIIIPTGSDITLDAGIRATLSVSDQNKAINYMYGSMSGNVRKVGIFDMLVNHKNEYIYFRTDHHWTALGAYYAYCEFCTAKGITPLSLESYTLFSYDGFLGSFYNDSGMNSALSASPDRVDAYSPPCNTVMTVTDNTGATAVRSMITNVTSNKPAYKYSTFIFGDNPFTVIENTDLPSGESCIVVKESFGNCFVPFLTYHYKYVYVIDYRYYGGTIAAAAAQYGVSDVIFCNNISMTRSEKLVNEFAAKLY